MAASVCRDRTPDTPHPFLDDPASAPLGWGLNTGHYDVRLTGQDCERGTFGQRHAVLWDQQTGGQALALLLSVCWSCKIERMASQRPLHVC
jgi:hypothetical protein